MMSTNSQTQACRLPLQSYVFLLCAYCLPTTLWAQQATASLSGSVNDLIDFMPAMLIAALALLCAVHENRKARRLQQELHKSQTNANNHHNGVPSDQCLAAEHSSIGLWLIGPDGKTLYMNRAMCQLLEINSMAELTPADFVLTPPESVVPRSSDSTYWTTLKGHYGRHHSVLVADKPILDEHGELRALLRSVTDLSEPKIVHQLGRHQAA